MVGTRHSVFRSYVVIVTREENGWEHGNLGIWEDPQICRLSCFLSKLYQPLAAGWWYPEWVSFYGMTSACY